MPALVTVYRTRICPYCVMAGRLLAGKGIAYTEVFLDGKPEERDALQARTNYFTVPQIFVGDAFVGGFTELAALERSGELQRMLERV